MEIKWEIIDAIREASTGKVLEISYLVIATDDKFMNQTFGKVVLDEASDSFIKFEDLKKETLVEWVKAKLGKKEVTKIEAKALVSIKKLKAEASAETKKNGLPWQ